MMNRVTTGWLTISPRCNVGAVPGSVRQNQPRRNADCKQKKPKQAVIRLLPSENLTVAHRNLPWLSQFREAVRSLLTLYAPAAVIVPPSGSQGPKSHRPRRPAPGVGVEPTLMALETITSHGEPGVRGTSSGAARRRARKRERSLYIVGLSVNPLRVSPGQ